METAGNPPNLIDPVEVARDFVQEVVTAMGLEVDVEAEETDDGTVRLDVVGEGAGEIIGRYGDGINALQYLTTLVTQRRTGEHVRVQLDAESYRRRREDALTAQALELAGEVKRTGQEAELDPLGAYERRIIHNALVGHPDVITYSEGEDPDRRVVIAPRPNR
jgi:spoIIIJ-associated protein